MGRAGSGRPSGGFRRSGGGHSIGRSGGGHRVGSSRAGSTRSYSRSTPPPSRGGYGAPPPTYRPRHTTVFINRGGRRYPTSVFMTRGRRTQNSTKNILASLIILIVFAAVMLGILGAMSGSGSSIGDVRSTISRKPLTDSAPFINDCIVDEIGWFDNESQTERRLQQFYKKTGVQPFIVLHAYDPALTSDSSKDDWAAAYYDSEIDNENTFLYVYFAEQDTDHAVGYMCYINGVKVSSVMDSEAVEIFWNYIDRYWSSDMSTDELFVTVFEQTADTIMRVSTTGADVAKTALIVIGIILILAILFLWWKARARREKEKAAETERILNTPIQDLVNESHADELARKYDQAEPDPKTEPQTFDINNDK